MLLLGIDIGTSSIKVSVVDSHTQQSLASTQYPETENEIISSAAGWAEQDANHWWHCTQQAILHLHALKLYNPQHITCIGISYQMHGLVIIDENQQPLRNSIIWCDGRAIELGNQAFEQLSPEYCATHLLNSPGNFTASKLAWVKKNEPYIYEKIYKALLPGDFIAMKFTGEISTTISALTEGVFWDFKNQSLASELFDYYGIDKDLIPTVTNSFTNHGNILPSIAQALNLNNRVCVSYKAGDQPNNAFALSVLNPGEIAANAGTSGVLYSVHQQPSFDKQQRINTFAHVNHTTSQPSYGTLLCINGTGILNRWMKNIIHSSGSSYQSLNEQAQAIAPGSDHLVILPFGNGPERILGNRTLDSSIHHINFNIHTPAHLYRAAQEGICFSFKYGLDILQQNGIGTTKVKAGFTNLFLSNVFTDCFVNALRLPLELYDTNGSIGAALGAGIGSKIYASEGEAFTHQKPVATIYPTSTETYHSPYQQWLYQLENQLNQS
jgi:xylulokinase